MMENGIMEKFRREMYTADDGYTMPYRLYIPENYDCGEQYPLVLFLHGAGERGDNNESQIAVGLPYLFSWDESPVYNAIVVAPQCPTDCQWVNIPWIQSSFDRKNVKESRELQAVLAILQEVMGFCNVDSDRVYVTGLSMGGFGTFDLLARHGSLFAAGVTVCGGCDPHTDAKNLSRIPIWSFHGSVDNVVPPMGSRLMYARIRNLGGDKIRYTEYSGMDHGIWNNAYSDREMVSWLFAQSRYERRMLAEKRARQKKTAAIIAGGIGAAAVTTAVVACHMHSKKKKEDTALSQLSPAAQVPQMTAVVETAETVVQTQTVSVPEAAVRPSPVKEPKKSSAPRTIKPIKKIKLPKASRTKALLHRAAGKAVDMTVQVIRRLSGI